MNQLDEAQPKPLYSVQLLKIIGLELMDGDDFVDVKFCRIFSRLFPNLEQLYLIDCITEVNYDILRLDLFVKLRNHDIQEVEYDDSDNGDTYGEMFLAFFKRFTFIFLLFLFYKIFIRFIIFMISLTPF